MIFDAKTNLAIDNLGWVDRGSLWTFDVVDRKEGRVPVADTSFIRVSKSKDSFFRLVYADKSGANLSIRHFRDPSAELAGLTLSDRSVDFRGDESLWSNFDKAVIVFTQSGQRLIWIDAAARSVTDLDISWFNNDNYDVGYSSLVDSLTLPGRRSVIVSAQRSSRLAIIDLERNKEVESFVLGDRSGNPHLHLLNDNELIADDYDTMCRVDIRNRKVIATAMLQPARAGVNQFIGHYDPHPNGTCAVARPFSGDVVLLDSHSFKVLKKAVAAGKPLSLSLTSPEEVVTRDWNTGKLAMAHFN